MEHVSCRNPNRIQGKNCPFDHATVRPQINPIPIMISQVILDGVRVGGFIFEIPIIHAIHVTVIIPKKMGKRRVILFQQLGVLVNVADDFYVTGIVTVLIVFGCTEPKAH
jgi:hypothetical protein